MRARVADGLDRPAQASLPDVLDDDAGARCDVGLDVGVGAAEVARGDRQARFVELTGERLALDQELDLEAGLERLIEHPDEQFRLADGQAPHQRSPPGGHSSTICLSGDYTPLGSVGWWHNNRVLVVRMAQSRIVMSAWAVIAGLVAAAAAQEPTFRAGIDLVTFGVTVTDRAGTYITDLTEDDFEVLEDGRPQTIRYFARGEASLGALRPNCTSGCCSTRAAA